MINCVIFIQYYPCIWWNNENLKWTNYSKSYNMNKSQEYNVKKKLKHIEEKQKLSLISLKVAKHQKLNKLLHKKEELLPWWLSNKETAYNAGAPAVMASIPRSGRSPGGGHGNPLNYSCLENPMDRGAWWATVHWVTKSQTRLKWFRKSRHEGREGYRIWEEKKETVKITGNFPFVKLGGGNTVLY